MLCLTAQIVVLLAENNVCTRISVVSIVDAAAIRLVQAQMMWSKSPKPKTLADVIPHDTPLNK